MSREFAKVGVYIRTADDSRVIAFDFTEEPDFALTPITSAAVAVDAAISLTVTTPADVSTPNVCKFRVSGGTAGTTSEIDVTATNGTDVIRRSLIVKTVG